MLQNELHKKNLEAELTVIKTELSQKTVELASIIKQADGMTAERLVFETEKAEFLKEKDAELARNAQVQTELAQIRANFAVEEEKQRRTMADLVSDIKEMTKTLARLNTSCLNAQNDAELLSVRKSEQEKQIAQMTEMLLQFEHLASSIQNKTDVLYILNVEIDSKKSFYDTLIQEKSQQLLLLDDQIKDSQENLNRIQYNLKEYTDRLYQKRIDYDIIRERIEGVWKKTFPELQLPLEI